MPPAAQAAAVCSGDSFLGSAILRTWRRSAARARVRSSVPAAAMSSTIAGNGDTDSSTSYCPAYGGPYYIPTIPWTTIPRATASREARGMGWIRGSGMNSLTVPTLASPSPVLMALTAATAPVTPPPTAPVAIPELPAAVAVALNEQPRSSSRESALPRCSSSESSP